jgi:hypothetical protein
VDGPQSLSGRSEEEKNLLGKQYQRNLKYLNTAWQATAETRKMADKMMEGKEDNYGT